MKSLLFIQIGLIGLLIGGAGLLMLDSGLFGRKPSDENLDRKSHQIVRFFVYIIFGLSTGIIVSNIGYILFQTVFARS